MWMINCFDKLLVIKFSCIIWFQLWITGSKIKNISFTQNLVWLKFHWECRWQRTRGSSLNLSKLPLTWLLTAAKWKVNCHWHATQVFTSRVPLFPCQPERERERFCVISSRSFNLSTPLTSHLNIEEFSTLIIPTQPKSEQLSPNQLANRLNLNFMKINKGKC